MSLLIKAIAARHHPSGSAFTPDSISGLVSWYDADQLPYNNLDLVDTWTDEKGSNDLTASGSTRPDYNELGVNGHASINFNQVDPNYMVTSGFTLSQPCTWFFVCRCGNAEDDTAYVFDYLGSGSRQALFSVNSTTPDAYRAYAGSFITGSTFSKNSWLVIVFVVNGASSKIYENGTQVLSGDVGANSCNSFTLGATSAFASPFNGQFAELGCYSQALSDTDRTSLQNYLGTKYGITIS